MKIKNTSLWWRVFAFFVLFVVISGKIGPMIINHSLVGEFGFGIYGGAGKALIFAAITFGLLAWRAKRKLELPIWRWTNLAWLVPGAVAYAVATIAIKHLWVYDNWFVWPLLTHLGIVTVICCAALAMISWPGMQVLWRAYRGELLVSLAVGVGFYVFLTVVYGLWEVLASTVMHAVGWLLAISGLDVNVLPPRYLILDKFSIEISQWCSGIESIALFTGLYAIVGIVDHDKLDFRKYAAVFVPALAAIFGCNILRVYLLIMLGYYVNEHIAFTLFHTYAGMIFFVLFAAVFWMLSYKWMLKKPAKSD